MYVYIYIYRLIYIYHISCIYIDMRTRNAFRGVAPPPHPIVGPRQNRGRPIDFASRDAAHGSKVQAFRCLPSVQTSALRRPWNLNPEPWTSNPEPYVSLEKRAGHVIRGAGSESLTLFLTHSPARCSVDDLGSIVLHEFEEGGGTGGSDESWCWLRTSDWSKWHGKANACRYVPGVPEPSLDALILRSGVISPTKILSLCLLSVGPLLSENGGQKRGEQAS